MTRGPMDATELDPGLLEHLYERHGPTLLGYLLNRTYGDRHLAEDLLQETFVRAWRRPGLAGDGQDNCRAWLFTVARNLLIDAHRQRARRPPETCDEPLRQLASPRCDIERADTLVTLREALANLSPTRQEIVHQVYVLERSHSEVARILGIPIGTVKSRLHAALVALRLELG